MLVIVLAILSATSLAMSRPTPQSMCQKYNAYTWELYSFLLQKPDDLKTCERMIARQSQNLNYCSSNSIQILNMYQRGEIKLISHTTVNSFFLFIDYPSATASISGSGAQPETTSNKCLFDITFSFSKGIILGGDFVFYKHAQSNDNFEIRVHNMSKNEPVIGSKTINGENTRANWNRVEINEFSAGLGVGDHHVQLLVQFIKNGEEISCQEAQSTFITNCTRPEVEQLSSNKNHGPALVLISQRESFLLGQQKRVTRTANDKSSDCTLKRRKISLKHLRNVGKLVSPGEIEIDRCVPRNGGECFPTRTRDLHFITSGNTDAATSIETIPNMIASQC